MITRDLSDFGIIDRLALIKILEAWNNYGLPDEFGINDVIPMYDQTNGLTFLANSERQHVALTDQGKLEIWNYCEECGNEGFNPDCELMQGGCNECLEDHPSDRR